MQLVTIVQRFSVAVEQKLHLCVAIALAATTIFLLAGGPVIAKDTGDAVEAPQFEFYGFTRLDAIYDDSRMQNHQFAFWVLSEDERIGRKNDSHLTVHPRVTRFGVRIKPRKLSDDVSARAVIELDFQNGGSESRQRVRMRMAYVEFQKSNLRFLIGQDWDMVSPLYPGVHLDGILWNAGNLGDRHPQGRITYTSTGNSFQAAVASGLTGAIDSQDFDKDGALDGQDSGQPFLQTRLGVNPRVWADQVAKIGVWGHWAKEEISDSPVGDGEAESWSAGFDASIPFTSRLKIEGEGWVGSDVSDMRGGIGQNINVITGDEVASRGIWAQLAVKPSDQWSTFMGGSADDPDDEDVPSVEQVTDAGLSLTTVGRTLNWVVFFANRYRPWQPFEIALEYYHWVTEYRGLEKGTDNRVDLYFSYFF